jgi:hypothetical protein
MTKAQWKWLIIILASLIGTLIYKLEVHSNLEQTSLLFIGIPAAIAIICVITPEPKSATGTALKAVTLFIGISGIFLGEGFICILMASPIFYCVAISIGISRDRAKKNSAVITCLVFIAMVPMSSEGVRPSLSFNREETVTAHRIIEATPDQIRAALNAQPHLDSKLPFYLRLGFPRPVAVSHQGSGIGSRETIHFAGGEGKPGDLVLEVVGEMEQPAPHSTVDGRISYRAVSDSSHVSHWMKWEESTVEWYVVDATHTRVQWTLRYRRLLDPAWYFGPWERYAARLAAEQLIQDAATPR